MIAVIDSYLKGELEIFDEDYDMKKVACYSSYLKDNIQQIDIKKVLDYINEKGYLNYYVKQLNSIKKEYLYKSSDHGLHHNERVMLFSLYLGLKESLVDYLDIIMDNAKYHDIGRINDFEDDSHGLRSSLKVSEIVSYQKEKMDILQAAIELHSINDNNLSRIIKKYNIKDTELFKKIYSILKDADALDRIRLSYKEINSYLNPDMLRLKHSKKLLKSAHNLYELFERSNL